MIDYPKVRASHICPTCNGPKAADERLLVCWPCFRDTRRVRTADMERTLREREAELSGIHVVRMGERPVKVAVAPDNPDASIDATRREDETVKRIVLCVTALLLASPASAVTVTITCDGKDVPPQAYTSDHGDLLEAMTEAIVKAEHDWWGTGGCYKVTVWPQLHGIYGCGTHGPCPPK